MAKKPLSKPVKIAIFAVFLAVFYFGNNAIQAHLGQKAFAETGLASNTLNEALALAKQDHKLVLADYSAIWCPACRQLDREVLSDETVKAAINSKYVFARIDYDGPESKTFKETYQVQGFPTLLVLDSNGEKLKQLATPIDPIEFAKQL